MRGQRWNGGDGLFTAAKLADATAILRAIKNGRKHTADTNVILDQSYGNGSRWGGHRLYAYLKSDASTVMGC